MRGRSGPPHLLVRALSSNQSQGKPVFGRDQWQVSQWPRKSPTSPACLPAAWIGVPLSPAAPVPRALPDSALVKGEGCRESPKLWQNVPAAQEIGQPCSPKPLSSTWRPRKDFRLSSCANALQGIGGIGIQATELCALLMEFSLRLRGSF